MRGEIKRTPSSVKVNLKLQKNPVKLNLKLLYKKKTEGGVIKRRNTITAASLTPSLQRRVTLKTIDQSKQQDT